MSIGLGMSGGRDNHRSSGCIGMNSLYHGKYLVLNIQYSGCTNYEGKKILVFKDVNVEQLEKQGSIDPHFGETKNYHWPIARFEPTDKGWSMAKDFVEMMAKMEK